MFSSSIVTTSSSLQNIILTTSYPFQILSSTNTRHSSTSSKMPSPSSNEIELSSSRTSTSMMFSSTAIHTSSSRIDELPWPFSSALSMIMESKSSTISFSEIAETTPTVNPSTDWQTASVGDTRISTSKFSSTNIQQSSSVDLKGSSTMGSKNLISLISASPSSLKTTRADKSSIISYVNKLMATSDHEDTLQPSSQSYTFKISDSMNLQTETQSSLNTDFVSMSSPMQLQPSYFSKSTVHGGNTWTTRYQTLIPSKTLPSQGLSQFSTRQIEASRGSTLSANLHTTISTDNGTRTCRNNLSFWLRLKGPKLNKV